MSDSSNSAPRRSIGRVIVLLFAALTLPTGLWAARSMIPGEKPDPAPAGDLPSVGGVPLFTSWPKDQKPEVAIILTGQTFGYLSPCGCSRPQLGGLERRANVFSLLRGKGWPVVGVDLGDLSPTRKVQEQDALKYETTMKSLADMGYVAVGLGAQEFDLQLWELLSRYTLQKPTAPPVVLAANLAGKDAQGVVTPREKLFDVPGAARKLVEGFEVVNRDPKSGVEHPAIGIASVIAPSVQAKIQAIDKSFTMTPLDEALPKLVAGLKADKRRPVLNVLLFVGTKDEATPLAAKYPEFNVILCQSDDPTPPMFPALANSGNTFILQVGHKGQNLGVLGLFKSGKGFELKYQLVPITESFLTPPGEAAAKANTTLQLLEDYTLQVKQKNLLAKYLEKPIAHPAMIKNPDANLSYVGPQKCQSCHANEFKIWSESKHSHAYEALEKLADRPALRQFDGECLSCHTIGFGYKTGFQNATETPQLKHNGCENCHGPGSGHAADPSNKKYLAAMSEWKITPTDRLPTKDVLEKLAAAAEKPNEPASVQLTAGQQRLMTAVSTKCMSCHDQENDPKFDLVKYMPKVYHSGFVSRPGAVEGLPPGVGKP